MEKPNVYSHILKSTIVFGGMQGFNVLIGLLRNKFVALFIGPAGMGLVALFTSTIKLLGDITNLGLPVSAVRELSKAYEDTDSSVLERLVSVFRRWTLCTALVGMVLCVVLSSFISQLAFSSGDYTWHIVLLSPAVAFATLAAGETALLKATRKIHKLVKSSVYSLIASLIITVPLYYFYGIRGVVPVLVLVALAQAAIVLFYSFREYPWRFRGMFCEGYRFVRLGIAFIAGGVIGSITEFAIRSSLSAMSDVETVGLYNAAYMILVTYAGTVFTSMETDYYPRLSAVPGVGRQFNAVVNRQIEVSVLLLAPLLVAFIVFVPVLLPLLFSSKFLPVLRMLQVAVLSLYARALFLPVEYISLSRKDSFAYITVETLSYVMLFASVVIGYNLGGLFGIGVGMTVANFSELLLVVGFYRARFRYAFSRKVVRIVSVQILLGALAYASTWIDNSLGYWASGLILFALSAMFSMRLLRKKSDIIEGLRRRFKR